MECLWLVLGFIGILIVCYVLIGFKDEDSL
jgi:hypothetical protein